MGVQTFTRNGELMEERTELKHKSLSTSRGRESYLASGLVPNCHYTCRLLSVARDRQSDADRSPQVTFHTLPGSKFMLSSLLQLLIQGSLFLFRTISSSEAQSLLEGGRETYFKLFT